MAHHGPEAYRNDFELVLRRESAHPNDPWQADHTELDVMVLDETGKPARPWLTVILDDRSRAVAGYTVFLGDPNALQTALALRQAVWRKTDPGTVDRAGRPARAVFPRVHATVAIGTTAMTGHAINELTRRAARDFTVPCVSWSVFRPAQPHMQAVHRVQANVLEREGGEFAAVVRRRTPSKPPGPAH